MKTHKEIQAIVNRTLEFILSHIETREDLDMLKTTIQDYKEMGYNINKFESNHKNNIETKKYMLQDNSD